MARLVEMLGLPVGSRVLDVPCGQGRHARLLESAGYQVTGVDYSEHLLRLARAAAGNAKSPQYIRADMRELPARFTGRFHAVLNLFSSFGFFLDPADDVRVISEFSRALLPGGVLVWHGGNRDVIATRFPERDWWTATDGTHVAQERSFDPLSGVLTVATSWRSGKSVEQREHRVRLYTATRLAELFAAHGLIVEQALDGDRDRELARNSSTMILLARKE